MTGWDFGMAARSTARAVIAAFLLAGCAGAAMANDTSAAQAHPALWPAAASPSAITDATTEREIDRLIARMTLAEKVGQVIQGDISSVTPADLARYPLGSILAGGNSGPYGNERADAATWARLVAEYRSASKAAGAGIPILFGVDAVHGHSNLPGATIFPHNLGLGAAHDPDLIRRIGEATAAEIAGSGIEWTFAPTLAAPQDFRWGRTYEGYSSDPQLVRDYASAMTLGLQGSLEPGRPLAADRVAATAKHFLADGGTAEGQDQGDARIAEQELVAIHGAQYAAAIDAGALTVMASFSSWNGVKHHGNASLLTEVLKQRMGFAGLVVGDWNAHGQVPGCTVTDCPASLNAGLDLYMAPDSWKGLFDSLLAEAEAGTVSAARLDDAVRRVLRVKAKLGLLGDTPLARGDLAQVGAADHLALAREAAAKSLVLLKNEGGVLPLRPGARVLVTGPGADDMAMQAGGWTITWQGTDTTPADYPNGRTIGRAIAEAVAAAGGTAVLDPSGAQAAGADVAVVVYGERPYAEFQGDRPDLAFRASPAEEALLERLTARGVKVVSVFLSGRPLFAGEQINRSDAFVAAWLPGTQGQGVADVLVAGADGKPPRDFTGTLPFAWPADARSPIAEPLFPVGYGLSYARPAGVGPVNEDPRVDLAASRSDERYFALGQAIEPWRLGIDAAVESRAVDLAAQEDARQFRWTAPGSIAIDGPPVDLARQRDQGFVLRLEWRVDAAGEGPVRVAVDGASLDLGGVTATPSAQAPSVLRVPLQCFASAGADLADVGTPLRISAGQGFAMILRDARIEALGETLPCPGQAR
jgi:beta-glucosidase